jgi:hypothetical protein
MAGNTALRPGTTVGPALPGVKRESSLMQGNRMNIVFRRNNACKDSGQKGAGFPSARGRRSE